jgi:hypothetical protein
MTQDKRSEVTAWPGQPLSTTDLQRLYPTTDHPAPFRPHKPWPTLGYGYSGPNVQSPPRYFPSPTPRHSTRGSMNEMPKVFSPRDNAHRLIDAMADRLITKELAHAYLAADLTPEQLDHILNAHTKPAPIQQPAHTFPGLHTPLSPMPKFGTAPWQVTSYPGQPLPVQEYHLLNTAPFRPNRPGQYPQKPDHYTATTATTASRLHRKPSR